MTSDTAPAPTGAEVPTVADAAGDLATALDRFKAAEEAICDGVLALSRTVGTGICETVEGLPTDLLLANLCRLIQADRSTVMTAADVLRTMPVTAGLWADGQLSWGQVRNIALKAARLPAAQRGTLDRRIAATADDHAASPTTAPTACWMPSTGPWTNCVTSPTSSSAKKCKNGPTSWLCRASWTAD